MNTHYKLDVKELFLILVGVVLTCYRHILK
jgi:hypothetical protein